jgi:4-hydroxybenzoate polyprenyltransferase
MNAAITIHRTRPVIGGLVKLMRPRQWVKNGFVLAPLVFAGLFTEPAAIFDAFVAMGLFCIGSSTAYIINDYVDIERDRLHPVKSKTRPLAAGLISKPHALGLLAALYVVLGLGYLRHPEVVLVIAAYLALNIGYTLVLKNQPVIDIFIIAIGFVVRVYVGAVAISVPVSSWMFVTTLCLALYLAAIKRRQELLQSAPEDGVGTRRVLAQYSVSLIDKYAEMAATGALLFYSLFVMTARPELVITIPIVMFGMFRYWFVVEALDGGESPTDALLTDWQLFLGVAAWVGASAWVMWPGIA